MKKCIIIFLFSSVTCFAQKFYHSIYAGGNFSGISLSSAEGNSFLYKNKERYTGFNIGYKFIIPVYSKICISGGIEYSNINVKFSRPNYFEPTFIDENFTSVKESIKFSRLSLPIEANYAFINKSNFSIYAKLGAELILVNSINRIADYYVVGPLTEYIKLTYEKKEKLKFNNDQQIGFALLGGIGSNFNIKNKSFIAELIFCNDVSKSKFYTLHNIETDSYFYGKLRSIELRIGHVFSLQLKK